MGPSQRTGARRRIALHTIHNCAPIYAGQRLPPRHGASRRASRSPAEPALFRQLLRVLIHLCRQKQIGLWLIRIPGHVLVPK